MTGAELADRLTGIADWLEERLDAQGYDHTMAAGWAVIQMRELAALARGGAS